QPQQPDPMGGATAGFPMPPHASAGVGGAAGMPGGPGSTFSDGQMLDPALLASMPNPNFEYPWGGWDPAVFQNVQMMDANQFGGIAFGEMSIEDAQVQQRRYAA
ncbi:MAG: hypothetical protein LQ340_003473, partial [Diploschistes diacapsis]